MKKRPFDRRQFIIIGASAAAGIAVTSAADARTRAVRPEGSVPAILSVGFAAAGGDSLEPAGSMPNTFGAAGSSSYRFTVHGMRTASPNAPRSNVRITAFFNSGGAVLPFYAWGTGGARVSFDIDGTDPVFIGVEGPGSARDGESLFVPEVESLSRNGAGFGLSEDVGFGIGTYVIALRRTAVDRIPNWHSFTLDAETLASGGEMIVRRGDAAPDFDYLVFSVDRA